MTTVHQLRDQMEALQTECKRAERWFDHCTDSYKPWPEIFEARQRFHSACSALSAAEMALEGHPDFSPEIWAEPHPTGL
jgi:hypothetical protein